jgi:hypothetical protein
VAAAPTPAVAAPSKSIVTRSFWQPRIERLYATTPARCRPTSVGLCRDRALAEDLLQETLIELTGPPALLPRRHAPLPCLAAGLTSDRRKIARIRA